MKRLIACLFLLNAIPAFAGGANTYPCSTDLQLTLDDYKVQSARLVISIWSRLELTISTPDLRNPTAEKTATCYNAFRNNDWNRFICIVGNDAVLVTTDTAANTCSIKSVIE